MKFARLADAWSATTPTGVRPQSPCALHGSLGASPNKAIDLAAQRDWPVAMHLGESLDEMELFRSHSGKTTPIAHRSRRLESRQACPRGIRLTDYLSNSPKLLPALAIHGNFFGDDEYEILARHRDRMSLVICPRTCDYFLPTLPPISELIAKGIRMALGTDSRATNPGLVYLERSRDFCSNEVSWLLAPSSA